MESPLPLSPPSIICPLLLLADETMIGILIYLRATDMCSCMESNKRIFTPLRMSRAIQYLLDKEYDAKDTGRILNNCKPSVLYCVEIKMILKAINSPTPPSGYWISATWLANSKLYYDALPMPDTGTDLFKQNTPNKRTSKIRARRGSDALPPWPIINSEILCSHGVLKDMKGLRAKRRIIDKKNWQMLRKFFPDGPEFRSYLQDCGDCAATKEVKLSSPDLTRGRYLDPNSPLYAVFMRKNGVPSHCLTVRDEVEAAFGVHMLRPLLPGLYHLVPREWLREWRQYIRDSIIVNPPLFDAAGVLCEEHGILLVPPHVEEYLVGVRRSLLGGLLEYTGEVMEILTTDEFSALQQDNIRGILDFHVCFSCDSDGHVQWSLERCRDCDPLRQGRGHSREIPRSTSFTKRLLAAAEF